MVAALTRPEVFILIGLALITLAIYGQVVRHQFIGLDDVVYLRDNLNWWPRESPHKVCLWAALHDRLRLQLASN
jgi:hypothetical protein